MEPISVYPDKLKEILKDIKKEGIRIKTLNNSGLWSNHFYLIEEVKDFMHRDFRLSVLILFNPEENDSTVIDSKSITSIELQRPFGYDGTAFGKINILRENLANKKRLSQKAF